MYFLQYREKPQSTRVPTVFFSSLSLPKKTRKMEGEGGVDIEEPLPDQEMAPEATTGAFLFSRLFFCLQVSAFYIFVSTGGNHTHVLSFFFGGVDFWKDLPDEILDDLYYSLEYVVSIKSNLKNGKIN